MNAEPHWITVGGVEVDVVRKPDAHGFTDADQNAHTVAVRANPLLGDANCSGSADSVDSLLTLRFDAGVSANTGSCLEMGQVVDVQNASPHPWGDVDSDGAVNALDALYVLAYELDIFLPIPGNCFPIGDEMT